MIPRSPGNIGEQLSDNPDLYISRDGGNNWEETLTDSWGVTVADHGGLIVAAKDYHQVGVASAVWLTLWLLSYMIPSTIVHDFYEKIHKIQDYIHDKLPEDHHCTGL